jgi:hypothetical protein
LALLIALFAKVTTMSAVLDKVRNEKVSPQAEQQINELIVKSFAEKYNQLGKLNKKLESMWEDENSSSPFARGIKGAFLNRAHGIAEIRKLHTGAMEGG